VAQLFNIGYPAMNDVIEPSGEILTPINRAAILLLAMGEDEAANVLKHLEPREAQRVGAAMSALGSTNARQIDDVVNHFLETVSSESGRGMGANDYLKQMLVGALGEQRASSVLERIVDANLGRLNKLKWMDSRGIADFILHEHPQIQAIVLSYLEPGQAAEVLAFVPQHAIKSELIMRVAKLESIPPGPLQNLSVVLEPQVGKQRPSRCDQLGGKRAAAEILNHLDNTAQQAVMAAIRQQNETLGDEIRALMFVFDSADQPLREKILRKMSKRAAELLQDGMEAKGPVRVSKVETAQKEKADPSPASTLYS
jgi:flagellar motor switch protein FliG